MEITVGDLIRQLKNFPDDAEVYFGGLTFNRLKRRGGKCVHLEFNQQVYENEKGEVVVENLE